MRHSFSEIRAHRTLVALCLSVVLAALMATTTADTAAASPPPLRFDLSLESNPQAYERQSSPRWELTVWNNAIDGQAVDVWNVKVKITPLQVTNCPRNFCDVELELSSGTFDPLTGIWTIPFIRSGESARSRWWQELFQRSPYEETSPEGVFPLHLQAAIIDSVPREPPELTANNAIEQWFIFKSLSNPWGGDYAFGDTGVDIRTDRLVPDENGLMTFRVNVFNKRLRDRHAIGLITSSDVDLTSYGVVVHVELEGLRLAGSVDASDGTHFDPITGLWDVGTLDRSGGYLEIPVSLGLEDMPLGQRCLTASVEEVFPPFDLDTRKRANDVAILCLSSGLPPISEGEILLWWLHDCVGVTAHPCGDDGGIKLFAWTDGDDFDVPSLHRLPSAFYSEPRSYYEPRSMLFHVQDRVGREIDADSDSVTDSTTVSWQTARKEAPAHLAKSGVRIWYSRMGFNDNLADWRDTVWTMTVSGLNGAAAPGRVKARFDSLTAGTLLDPNPTASRTFNLTRPVTRHTDFFMEFDSLGTYVVNFHALATRTDGTEYEDDGNYTFRVGPIAELEVRDGGHSPLVVSDQRAYTIKAANNGPDEPPAVVTLTGVPKGVEAITTDGTYREVSCANGVCDAVWDIGRVPVTPAEAPRDQLLLPTLTLIPPLGVEVVNRIQAAIAASKYTVCIIDGDGRDVLPKPASQTACEATSGNSWHSTDYFDYVDDNNEAFIQSRTGTGERESHGLRAQFYPDPPIAIVLWDELESVHGLVVSHYEVWSAPAPCQTPGEDDAVVERSITIHLDYSIDPDTPTCYAVRAVNNDGTPGFWSEPVMATDDIPGQPRLWVRGGDPVNEGDAAQFTVRASPAPAADDSLTFHYTVIQRGGYVAAGDLGRKEATIGNSGRATITVPTVGNDTDDADGEVFVTLNNGEGYTVSSDRSASVEVRDNDNPSVSFADDPATATVSEGDGTYDVVVNLVPAPHAATTIRYQIGGVAEAGEDFTIGGLSNGFGTVTAGPGQSSVPIRVRLSDDGTSEDDEWVDIYLRAGENYDVGTPSRYTLTITDNDGPGAQFARADSEVGESDGSVGVTVNLVPAPTEDVTINYTLGGGTAQSGDYSIEGLTGSSGSVTVSAGINSVGIPVTINPDGDSEPDETVVLTLGNSSDYTVGTTRTHTLTILDDDRPRAEFASAESTVVEADTTHPVTVNLRPAAPAGGLTLSYGVRSTATRNRDYRASGTVQVSEDAESVDIPVSIIHNGESEPDETVELTLRVGSGNNVGEESVHTLTITDNNLPMVAFEAAEASVSEKAGRHRAVITLDPAPHEDLTIGYTVDSSGTATEGVHGQHGPGDDFTIRDSGTVTVPRGRNQVFVPITIVNDADAEGDETLTLTLDSGDGYALDTSATIYELTILDDDAPEVSFTAASGEPGEGSGTHVVLVRLDGQTDNPVTVGVNVSFPPNIGSDNTDVHSPIPGSVMIPAGMLETEIEITITDDNLNEADEVVVLTLEPGTGYSLSQGKPTEYTLTIVDNDADENTPVASRDHPHAHGQGSTHFEVYEGHTRIPTWYVTGNFAGDVIFQYVGGTATLDEDFRLFNIDGQIEKVGDTFTVRSLESPHDSDREAGFRWARFTFDPIRDQEREGGETVILRVLNGPGYTVEEPTELTITIID